MRILAVGRVSQEGQEEAEYDVSHTVHDCHLKYGMATDPRSPAQGAEAHSRSQDGEPQRGRGRSKQLSPHLQIPKNRSTGNLAVVAEGAEDSERSPRFRFSFDTGSGAALDYDSIIRYVVTF